VLRCTSCAIYNYDYLIATALCNAAIMSGPAHATSRPRERLIPPASFPLLFPFLFSAFSSFISFFVECDLSSRVVRTYVCGFPSVSSRIASHLFSSRFHEYSWRAIEFPTMRCDCDLKMTDENAFGYESEREKDRSVAKQHLRRNKTERARAHAH